MYGTSNTTLPQRIGPSLGGYSVGDATRDPQTGRPYEYMRVDARHYRLCAVFNRASETGGPTEPYWAHGAGRTCYLLAADAPGPVRSTVTTTVTH